ncbi:MAG TPA: hypothetical protein PLH70_04205 [Bacteroidales bacterium]|nr:hypothetical protein [Bacteroidales bacterium]HOH22455.1 hypothetical protein [Bacteroidales bacterium]HPB56940.1 hypothetical protein [Bacteroidales bacterium]HPZ03555.1 hypothetical protein [Bacteroidales bacterium]HQB74987.1 hypothetical protein [Bacteroidales bacterium]
METNQIKLLNSLAKEIKTKKKDKTGIIITLQSAKILTKQGNFTGKFNNLNRIVITAK